MKDEGMLLGEIDRWINEVEPHYGEAMLTQVLAIPNGARFYRADLHNHTPVDPTFNCGGYAVDTEEEKKAFAKAYVKFLKEIQQIEIVGITEHNDVSWLPYIQAAADEIGLTVFPGVELGARDGKRQIHYLALFNPGTDPNLIDHFISTLDLRPDKRFHPDGSPQLIDLDARDLTARIATSTPPLNGIPIAAHVSSTNGIFQELAGESRKMIYCDPHLLAVEIPAERTALSNFECQLVNGELDTYDHKAVACLNHSDGRGMDEVNANRPSIGARHTNIKLSQLSVEALRQAFIDFDSRVRLAGEERSTRAPQILGLVIDGPESERFLSAKPKDEQVGTFLVHFNPNLNTLIGGRGTGKSSVLEALRYAFALEPRTEATAEQARHIVAATLGAGTQVTVFYEMADGTRYQITREKGHDPIVYDTATGEVRGVPPALLLPEGAPAEIYGQKEIFEISKNVAFQLNLLDTYIAEPLSELQRQDAALVQWLNNNASDILRLQDEVDQAEQRLQELAAVRLELERMERHQAAAQLEKKKRAEREKVLLDRAKNAVVSHLETLTEFSASLDSLRSVLPEALAAEELPHTDLLASQAAILQQIDDLTAATLVTLNSTIEATWAAGHAERQAWKAAYRQTQTEYEALLTELGEAFSSERYFAQQAKLQALEGIERETTRRKAQLVALRNAREEKLQELRRVRRTAIFRVRARKAQELTSKLSGTVRITVTREGNRTAYANILTEFFAGHGITRAIFANLAKTPLPATKGTPEEKYYPDPIHLAQAIRCEREGPDDDKSLLATLYDISPAYRRRLAGIEEEVLFRLETSRIPDLPDICLKVGNQYRSLTPPEGEPGLSTGQKCTAILSLILVERNAPLIIDQPEDDLDNEFIYREIVQTLRREKEHRQFIIATHNANIPVSGDAELILAMQANESHGWIDYAGSIDDPQMRKPVEDILEGGKEAFEFRQKKYSILE
jgi:hypothetical protein